MKMKIIKLKFFLFIFLITLIFQPINSMTIRLSNENNLSDLNKKQDFYNESFRHGDYETPRIIHPVQSQMWTPNQSLEINNNLINMNNNINPNNYIHNTSPIVRINNPQNIIQRIPNTVMGIENCPCISRVKCQPCGIAPALDFSRNSLLECPCAPKPNCPVCPPLSLIHEIASKKVKL